MRKIALMLALAPFAARAEDAPAQPPVICRAPRVAVAYLATSRPAAPGQAPGQSLIVVTPEGETTVPTPEKLRWLHPAGEGRFLAGTGSFQIVEIGLDGKPGKRTDLQEALATQAVGLIDARILDGNRLLVLAHTKDGDMEAETRKLALEMAAKMKEDKSALETYRKAMLDLQAKAKTLVAELDAEGKILRQAVLPGLVTRARLTSEGNLLVVVGGIASEFGWDGKKRFELPRKDPSVAVHDILALEEGRYVYIADVTHLVAKETGKTKKTGILAECGKDGKSLWEASHACPQTVDLLPDGHFLIGAG